MKKNLLITLLMLLFSLSLSAQGVVLEGVVLDQDKQPAEAAMVLLKESEQWAMADSKGRFRISNIHPGKYSINVSCLGFVERNIELDIKAGMNPLNIILKADNLTLASAVVTAKEDESSAATTRTLDKTALDHVQMLNVTDIGSLLPGGATKNTLLTSEQRFTIRSGNSEAGNTSFGTAVEVDGVRLSSNASYGDIKGAATNNLPSSSVESIEIISGVPSVEYGDIAGGVVKINTRKGKTPFIVTMTTNPNTKQFSLGKGFGLGTRPNGSSLGTLNINAEYTKSIKEVSSPYTSYTRKNVSLVYSSLADRGFFEGKPIRFGLSASAGIGGYDSEADPDTFKGTYDKTRDNNFRGKASIDWLLNKSWITSLNLEGSVTYSDKLSETRSFYSSAAGTTALHGTQEGYYVAEEYSEGGPTDVILIPPGSWYNIMFVDDKPLAYKLGIKAGWSKSFGKTLSKLKLGATLSGDGNLGRGQYSEDISTAPTYRPYVYSEQPFMNNLAFYIEENLDIHIGKTELNVIGGLRQENTAIKDSPYGIVSSLSPRGNFKYYILKERGRSKKFVRALSFRGGAGISVKQPSFKVLYPIPTYESIEVLKTPSVDGKEYRGFYIKPKSIVYNPDLKWQKLFQAELGADIKLSGTKVSLAGYYTKTLDSYFLAKVYDSFPYTFVSQVDLNGCAIPAKDREYQIDRESGVITVSDKTGALPYEVLDGESRKHLVSKETSRNSISDIHRMGLEWVIDFPRINPISTDIRLDGSWYWYHYSNDDLVSYAQISSGTRFLPYVGWFVGGRNNTTGSDNRNLRMNVTFTTHIPSVRMIVSAKVESTLYTYSKSFNHSGNTYPTDSRNDYLPSSTRTEFDGMYGYTVTYPKYFSNVDEPDDMKDFKTEFLEAAAAKDTNPDAAAKYNDLRILAITAAYNYYYVPDYISPSFSANFSVTKEIGDIASISFYANNFFNSVGKVYSTKNKRYYLASNQLPGFYYGLTLRLKF